MAIYHLHCDIIGRTEGRSAVAAAAYRATCKLDDRTTGESFDFTRKEKALWTEILTNGDVPEWATNREELWNSCEEKENRRNSQFCRSFDIAFPREFDQSTNKKLIEKWVFDNYVSRGLVADICSHAPHVDRKSGKTNDNYHVHVLVTTRKMNKDGWAEKDREGNDRQFLKKVRKSWADIVNAEFERRGMSERIDERTLKDQGIDREPQQHQGVTATAMERKGKEVRRKKYKVLQEDQTAKRPELPAEVTEEEVLDRLEFDPEYIALQTMRLKAVQTAEIQKWTISFATMKPVEWADFSTKKYPAILSQAYDQACEIWVQKNVQPIRQAFQEDQQTLNFLDQKKYGEVRTAIAKSKPGLLERMREGAKKIFNTNPIFAPIRAMITAFLKIKSQKDKELQTWQKAKKGPQNDRKNKSDKDYHQR